MEYAEAMGGVKDALADMFEIEKKFISSDFVADHLKDIEKAATGDEDAIDNFSFWLLHSVPLYSSSAGHV